MNIRVSIQQYISRITIKLVKGLDICFSSFNDTCLCEVSVLPFSTWQFAA